MTVEQREVFIAFDGKEFKTEEECINYEESLTDIIPALKQIRKICSEKQLGCQSCMFYNYGSDNCILREEFPENWDLERITG